MGFLNMSKVAVGCASIDALKKRQLGRLAGDHVPIVTRFMPRRAEELVGGSIYWIIKHRISVRQRILGFVAREEDKRTIIQLCPVLVTVKAQPKRAHQGWRYLAPDDAPVDFDGTDDLMALPADLAAKLSSLMLI